MEGKNTEDKISIIECDDYGMIKYNPQIHYNHNKPWTILELAYLCTFYKRGERKNISLALGRTEKAISSKYYQLKKNKEIEIYRNTYQKSSKKR